MLSRNADALFYGLFTDEDILRDNKQQPKSSFQSVKGKTL
jgi:hypothetical protein